LQKKEEVKSTDVQWTPITLTNLNQYFEKDHPKTMDTNNSQHLTQHHTTTEENNI
jgi:hypothetical protein